MALVFQQMALFNYMMTLGRWYYLVSVLRTLRRNGVKEFAHNLTPNEWVQLQFTLDSKPSVSLREHRASLDTDYIK